MPAADPLATTAGPARTSRPSALLIVNPNATSTTPAARDLFAHALESRTELTVAHTMHRGHAAELSQWAAAQRMDLIVVHGGDGTVNEVINGFLPAPAVADDQAWIPRLAILPGGSANVFARSLGIPLDPVAATNQLINMLTVGTRRRIGLGHADGRWFTFAGGMGLDAAVCAAIDAARAKGKAATPGRYVRATAREYFRARRTEPALTIEVPGSSQPVTDKFYAMVSNSSPWTFLDTRPLRTNPGTTFEGGLGVFAMGSMTVPATVRMLRQMLRSSGEPKSQKLFRADDVPSVRITASRPVAFQLDGDYLGDRTDVQFTAVADALEVIAPAG